MSGVRTTISAFKIGAFRSASFSAWIVAIVFGVTSPNTTMISVMIAVAAVTAALPPNRFAMTPVIAEAERLTILLPIRIAVSILCCLFSMRSSASLALLFPSSDRLRSRRRLTLIMAVSAEEKKEER